MTIKCYVDFKKRLFGFMFKIKKIDYGLCLPKCNSIHTLFMFQPIDVIMTDKNHKILYIYSNLKPWRIILPKKGVYYTYELPVGSIKILKVNDIFKKPKV
ncbi:MAG: hypothetical protein GX247_03795 [Mollicutes bacterium]|nr:hypothetical protein [Mollicutes bacterium]